MYVMVNLANVVESITLDGFLINTHLCRGTWAIQVFRSL